MYSKEGCHHLFWSVQPAQRNHDLIFIQQLKCKSKENIHFLHLWPLTTWLIRQTTDAGTERLHQSVQRRQKTSRRAVVNMQKGDVAWCALTITLMVMMMLKTTMMMTMMISWWWWWTGSCQYSQGGGLLAACCTPIVWVVRRIWIRGDGQYPSHIAHRYAIFL